MDLVIDLDGASPSPALTTPAVALIAADPLLRSGVAAQLRAYADLRLVDADDVGAPADVVVVATDAVHGATLAPLVDAAHPAAGVVVVAGGIDARALHVPGAEVVCEWVERSIASPCALGRAVMSAWRCRHRPGDHARGAPPALACPAPLSVPARPLSGRELDVLCRIADGYSTAEIADQLSYSESTIKNIVHQAASALGARNRTHAVVTAIRQGLIAG